MGRSESGKTLKNRNSPELLQKQVRKLARKKLQKMAHAGNRH